MSTHETSGEKLLSTVLQKFPLVSEWDDLCAHHRVITSGNCRMLCLLGLVLSGVCGWVVYSILSTPTLVFDWGSTIFGFFITVCCCWIGGGSLSAACNALWYNFSPRRQKKHLRSNKPAVRDYIAQKKAVHLVATLVSEFSTADLKLLQSHPQFNSNVFKSVFEKELKTRAETQIVNNVNMRFTENYVNPQIEESKDVFCAVKNNVFVSSTKY